MHDLAKVGQSIIHCPWLHFNLFISGGVLCLPECDNLCKNSGGVSTTPDAQELSKFRVYLTWTFTETTLEMFSQELVIWSAKLEVSNQEL